MLRPFLFIVGMAAGLRDESSSPKDSAIEDVPSVAFVPARVSPTPRRVQKEPPLQPRMGHMAQPPTTPAQFWELAIVDAPITCSVYYIGIPTLSLSISLS